MLIGGLDLAEDALFLYYLGGMLWTTASVVVGLRVVLKQRSAPTDRSCKGKHRSSTCPPVSIIVPAHNEEVTIVSTLLSLLKLDYECFEIIVVDDGSEDETSKRVTEAFGLLPIDIEIEKTIPCQQEMFVRGGTAKGAGDNDIKIMLIWKVCGRKADALNMGVNAASFDYFVCVDADSVLQSDALEKIVQPVVHDDNVVAVGGWVCPGNDLVFVDGRAREYHLPRCMLACMQVFEYARSFLSLRILLDRLDNSLIISGAFGLFRKDVVIATGGYDVKTVGEDMDMVVRLHKHCLANRIPYSVRYAINAVCWTQVPERISELYGQRRRWTCGLVQCMRKYHRLTSGYEADAVGLDAAYGYFLFYELLQPFVEMVGVVVVVLDLYANTLNFAYALAMVLGYVMISLSFSLFIFFSHLRMFGYKPMIADKLKAIVACIVESSVMHVFLSLVRAYSIGADGARNLRWGSMERKNINIWV